MWRVASACAHSKRVERCLALSGSPLFRCQVRPNREDVTSVKVSVRFSFQGPREPALRQLAPVNGEANLSCASRAGQLLFLCSFSFPPAGAGGSFRRTRPTDRAERSSRGSGNLVACSRAVKKVSSFFLRPNPLLSGLPGTPWTPRPLAWSCEA